MSRARWIGLLLACTVGGLIGVIWSAIDRGIQWGGLVLPLALAIAAYVLSWGLKDDQ